METKTFNSVEIFDGEFPKMSPMLESVWKTLGPIILAERDTQDKINLVSNRVGLLTSHNIWVHQCKPRAAYSRLRRYTCARPKEMPRVLFTCVILREDQSRAQSAQLLMNGKLVEIHSSYTTNYVWHWLRGLATFYTSMNVYSHEQNYCMECRAPLTKKERTLIYLNILGRKIYGGNRLA
ncbi:MAG: hypothetical protein MN733_37520 [Nitrososphaera sp.]|nr:hypothetical protein [Nitrososphaera sp.]